MGVVLTLSGVPFYLYCTGKNLTTSSALKSGL